MSDEIPSHVQEEIMKRLPVKSLVQFRSVSKAWKSLIDSSDFIAAHCVHSHTHPQHPVVSFETPEEEVKYLCFIDDETLFQQRSVPNSPFYVEGNHITYIVGVSHGLVCLYCPDTMVTVIWNPSIRKFIVVALPNTPFLGEPFVGFGVCPVTTDPKIYTIKQSWDKANNMETSYQCEVLVYTLSSGNWRSLSTNLPTKPLQEWWAVVAADGFSYWRGHNMIISFDATNESFQMIDLPTTLACYENWAWHIYKLRESLAILEYDANTCTIWRMEDGFQRSFAKLFVIQLSGPNNSVLGFTKSGVPILQVENDQESKLVVYECNSEHNNVFGISKDFPFLTVKSYKETLFLLGRSDCSCY